MQQYHLNLPLKNGANMENVENAGHQHFKKHVPPPPPPPVLKT